MSQATQHPGVWVRRLRDGEGRGGSDELGRDAHIL
jgi:hypothetical protein